MVLVRFGIQRGYWRIGFVNIENGVFGQPRCGIRRNWKVGVSMLGDESWLRASNVDKASLVEGNVVGYISNVVPIEKSASRMIHLLVRRRTSVPGK